jgi:ribosome modulation factor
MSQWTFNTGYGHGLAGGSVQDCPHLPLTDEWREWLEGYAIGLQVQSHEEKLNELFDRN